MFFCGLPRRMVSALNWLEHWTVAPGVEGSIATPLHRAPDNWIERQHRSCRSEVQDPQDAPPFALDHRSSTRLFLSRQRPLDAARMDRDSEALLDQVCEFLMAELRLLRECFAQRRHHLCGQLVGPPRSRLLGQQRRPAAPCAESRPRLARTQRILFDTGNSVFEKAKAPTADGQSIGANSATCLGCFLGCRWPARVDGLEGSAPSGQPWVPPPSARWGAIASGRKAQQAVGRSRTTRERVAIAGPGCLLRKIVGDTTLQVRATKERQHRAVDLLEQALGRSASAACPTPSPHSLDRRPRGRRPGSQ